MFNFRNRYAKEMIAAFGGASMRAITNHAKFTVIRNEEWAVTICSSMNLNLNRKLENFVIFESREVADFYSGIVDRVFASVGQHWDGETMTREEYDAVDIGAADAVDDEKTTPPAKAVADAHPWAKGVRANWF